MAKFKLRGPDGGTYAITADTPEAAHAALYGETQTDTPKNEEQPPPQTQPAKPKEQSYSKDLAYGLENDILRGSSNTLQQSGYPNAAAALAKAANVVHSAAGLDDYSPDGGDKSLGGRVSNIGHTLVQGAPGMAQDIAAGAAGAAVGGPLAPVTGLLGFGGSYALRHLGEVKDRIREAAGKGPERELTTGEQLRAGGTLLADTLLNRFGVGKVLKPGPVKAVGLKAAPEIAAKTAEGIATGAGVGAGQTALDSVALDQKLPSFSDLAVSGLTGAAAGAVGGIPNVAKESLRAGRFKELGNLDPQSRSDVTNVLEKYKGDFNATQQYHLDEINKAKKDLDPVTQDNIDKEVIAFKNGQRVDPDKLSEVTKVDPVAGRALQNLDTLSAMKSTNNGGLSGTGFGRMVEPFGSKFTNVMDLGSIGTLMFGHHLPYLGAASPYIAGGLLAGQGLGYGITRGLDRLSGASNPSKVIIDKFGGDPSSTTSVVQARTNANNLANIQRQFRTSADLYSASDELNQAKAVDKQSRDAIKAENALTRLKSQFQTAAANDARVEQKAQERAVNDFWKEQRERLAIRTNSDIPASEYLGQDLGANQNVPLPELVSSDTSLALKLAKLKQQLQDKRMTQLGKQASIMRNSQDLTDRQATAEQNEKDQALLRQVNLMRNSQATEQARQGEVLRNVGQQNRIRIASEALAERQANAEQSAQEQAQAAAEAEAAANTPRTYNPDEMDWGPSTSVKDRPEDVQALYDANKALLRSRKKLEKEQEIADRKAKKDQEKKDREAKKLKDDETKAKASKRVKDATEEATKAEEKLASTPIEDGDHYEVTVRGMTFRGRKDKIPNPKGWADATKENVEHRGYVIDEMSKVVSKDAQTKRDLKTLEHLWSERTRTPEGGQEHFEDFLHKQPLDVQSKLLDIYAKHEALLRTRWTPSK